MGIAVYLAGKIRKNDWRKKICPEIRSAASSSEEIFEATYTETKIPSLLVSGPYFISCDHGCYHGEKSHGVGAYDPEKFSDDDYKHGLTPELCSGEGIPSNLVPQVCKKQIANSNFVFAYIDSPNCYGTLFEIGYAVGNGIPVAVMFSGTTISEDMWFIAESADIVFNQYGYPLKVNMQNSEIYALSRKIATLIDSEVI